MNDGSSSQPIEAGLVPADLRGLGLVLLALALTACGGGGAESGGAARYATGVLHLDPRLADGRSCATVLGELPEVRGIRPTPAAPDLGPWELVGGELGEAGGLLTVRPSGADSDGDGLPNAPYLAYQGTLEASDVRFVDLWLQVEAKTHAVVRWRGPGGAKRGKARVVRSTEEPGRRLFDLSEVPEWKGTIEDLEVVLSTELESVARLVSLSLVPYGFEWGKSPDAESGDAGLRQRGLSLRRAWPADSRHALHATVPRVPRGGTLTLSVARGNNTAALTTGLSVRVDGRRPDGGWESLVTAELTLASRVAELEWQPLVADLSPFAGGALELRFSTGSDGTPDDAPDASPTREDVLWGEPLVLGDPPPDPRPSILLVTLDTTRADATGGEWTPHLTALGSRGFVYTNAWSTANSTTLSHSSIMTGLPGVTHGAMTNRHSLPEHHVTLAERFRRAGYATAAAVSAPQIDSRTGLGQGFDRFAVVREGAWKNGALTLEQVEEWFEEWSALPRAPRFLWFHVIDAHTPYKVPWEWLTEYIERRGIEQPAPRVEPPTLPLWSIDGSRDPEKLTNRADWLGGATSIDYVRFRYHLGVAYADELLGRAIDGMERVDARDNLLTVVTADHGEALGEHGIWYSHAALTPETLHVPLVLNPPERLGLGSGVVDVPVSTADIAPTLLRLVGVGGADELEGRDLLDPAALDEPRTLYFAFDALHQEGFRDAEHHFVVNWHEGMALAVDLVETEEGVRPVRRKRLRSGRVFLYDTLDDPGLLQDLSKQLPEEAQAAKFKLEAWREPRRAESVKRRDVSAEEEAALQAMGYAGDD